MLPKCSKNIFSSSSEHFQYLKCLHISKNHEIRARWSFVNSIPLGGSHPARGHPSLQTHKKKVFSTPRDDLCFSDHDVWDKRTWDGYLQAPKTYEVISYTWGQQLLIFVEKTAKKQQFYPYFWGVFWPFSQQKSTIVDPMCMIWPHTFWGLVSINTYLKPFDPKYHGQKSMSHLGGSKKPSFCPCTRFLE